MGSLYIEKINNTGKVIILRKINKADVGAMSRGMDYFCSLMERDNPHINKSKISDHLMDGEYNCTDNSKIRLRHSDKRY